MGMLLRPRRGCAIDFLWLQPDVSRPMWLQAQRPHTQEWQWSRLGLPHTIRLCPVTPEAPVNRHDKASRANPRESAAPAMTIVQ
jgi:hypothetical protein